MNIDLRFTGVGWWLYLVPKSRKVLRMVSQLKATDLKFQTLRVLEKTLRSVGSWIILKDIRSLEKLCFNRRETLSKTLRSLKIWILLRILVKIRVTNSPWSFSLRIWLAERTYTQSLRLVLELKFKITSCWQIRFLGIWLFGNI